MQNTENAAYPALIQNAMELMENEYAYLEGIEDLANRLGVSKCHLIRSFSDETGKTPGQYLTDVRIRVARFYLENREYSLETIAGLTGFSGSNYFCRVFRKTVGMSPGQYRKFYGNGPYPAAPPGEGKSFV